MNTDHRSHLTQYAVRFILALAISLVIIGPLLAHAAAIPDRRFGAIDTFDNPSAATALGAGWTRVRFPWADLQPNNDGEWNNNFFTDDQLAAELAAGREVVGLIVNTPHWALEDGSVPGVPVGRGAEKRKNSSNFNAWPTMSSKPPILRPSFTSASSLISGTQTTAARLSSSGCLTRCRRIRKPPRTIITSTSLRPIYTFSPTMSTI